MSGRPSAWLFGAGVIFLAGSAPALILSYDMAGSEIAMVNQACPVSAPCTVPVTGTITLEDDEAGNILLTEMSLAHGPNRVSGLTNFIRIELERTSIGLGAGHVAGSGSTLGSSVAFGATTLAQTGTITCTSNVLLCSLPQVGLPEGSSPLVPTVAVNLGTWTFDGLRDLLVADFVYTNTTTPSPATETLSLVGTATIIPEPGTVLLVAAGLAGLALRRHRRAPACRDRRLERLCC